MVNKTKRFSIILNNLLYMHSKMFIKTIQKKKDNNNLIGIKTPDKVTKISTSPPQNSLEAVESEKEQTRLDKETLNQSYFWWSKINIIAKQWNTTKKTF